MSKTSLPRARSEILRHMLSVRPFPGWTREALALSAVECGYDALLAEALFPAGPADALAAFSTWADEEMIRRLKKTDPQSLRVRDRIRTAVIARYEFLNPYKDAVRQGLAFWAMPFRKAQAARLLWKTVDRIWVWAGDDARYYNRYTKRALLCGVIASTTLCWLNDQNENLNQTKSFLDRRIENVMEFGKIMAKIKIKS